MIPDLLPAHISLDSHPPSRLMSPGTRLALEPGTGIRSNASMSDPIPHRIEVSAESFYIEAQSDPEANRYVFAYTITIRNVGRTPARLLRRHWVITDSHGKVEEVRGDGVVGEQPRLSPGEMFRYTSGAIIETPVGTMRGSYRMVADDGASFDAEIPEFALLAPRTLH